MPRFGRTSNRRLDTCHLSLGLLFREVVKVFDCSVIYGVRTTEEQQALYAKGRTAPGEIVTHRDGVRRKSEHQAKTEGGPSWAVDVAPYPVEWADTDRMYYFAGWVMGLASIMDIPLRYGGDWDRDTEVDDQTFMDLVHFELMPGS